MHHQKIITPIRSQEEGINQLPQSPCLKIGFLNLNGLYTSTEDRMLEVSQHMQDQQIDIFGLAETNIHWNNKAIYKYQQKNSEL